MNKVWESLNTNGVSIQELCNLTWDFKCGSDAGDTGPVRTGHFMAQLWEYQFCIGWSLDYNKHIYFTLFSQSSQYKWFMNLQKIIIIQTHCSCITFVMHLKSLYLSMNVDHYKTVAISHWSPMRNTNVINHKQTKRKGSD